MTPFPLGELYEFGRGTYQSHEQARFWYQKAAQKKYSLALENLARMNELGLGIEINLMEAERLYHEANKYRIHQPKSDLRRKKAEYPLARIEEVLNGLNASYQKIYRVTLELIPDKNSNRTNSLDVMRFATELEKVQVEIAQMCLNNNKIGWAITTLIAPIKRITTLSVLELRGNDFGENEMNKLKPFLEGNKVIKVLDLSNNKLNDNAIRILVDVLKSTDIEELYLFRNKEIGEEGFKSLSTLIKESRTLRVVDLRDNNMDDECENLLRNSVKENPNSVLSELKLYFNPVYYNNAPPQHPSPLEARQTPAVTNYPQMLEQFAAKTPLEPSDSRNNDNNNTASAQKPVHEKSQNTVELPTNQPYTCSNPSSDTSDVDSQQKPSENGQWNMGI